MKRFVGAFAFVSVISPARTDEGDDPSATC